MVIYIIANFEPYVTYKGWRADQKHIEKQIN